MTDYRGYRKPNFISVLQKKDFSYIFIVPEDNRIVHPFKGSSHRYFGREDLVRDREHVEEGTLQEPPFTLGVKLRKLYRKCNVLL